MADRTRPAYAPRMAPEQRREQLLDAVLQVIVDKGVHRVSIDTVAKQAGVSRPVVYSLFEDSDALLRASLDREEAAALAGLAQAVPVAASGDPAQAVAQGLERFLAIVQAAPDRWRAVFQLADASTPTFRTRLDHGRQAFIGALETFVRAAIPPDRASAVDVELTARAIYAAFWESGRLVLADPETFPPQRIHDFARAFIPAIPAFGDNNQRR